MNTNKQLLINLKTRIDTDIKAAGINGVFITEDYKTTLPLVVILGRVVTSKEAINNSVFRNTQEIDVTLRSNNKISNENIIDIISNSAAQVAKTNSYINLVASGVDETDVEGTTSVVEKTLTLSFEAIIDASI